MNSRVNNKQLEADAALLRDARAELARMREALERLVKAIRSEHHGDMSDPNPDVRALVQAGLKAGGFDGLWNCDGECACLVDDLCPCDEPCIDCQAGYKAPCDCGEHDWHIKREKPEVKP